jgi:hypothetical protein
MTGNMLTLADARSYLKPFVDGGTCRNEVVDARIAEAEERLWPKADWRASHRKVRARVQNQTFCVPWEVEKIIGLNIDGTPAEVMTDYYEFLSSGPGELDVRSVMAASRNCVDQGEFPTQFDAPIIVRDGVTDPGTYLMAFAPEIHDTANPLLVLGYGDKMEAVRETLQINRWAGGIEGSIVNIAGTARSSALFRQVTQVHKSVSTGYVSLYCYDAVTQAMYFLSKMGPEETVPMYRRYRLTDCQECAVVNMLVKLRFRRATRETDVLCIQSLAALKNMIMAISMENAKQLQGAVAYEMNAVRLLTEQKANAEPAAPRVAVIDHAYPLSLGAGMNHAIR